MTVSIGGVVFKIENAEDEIYSELQPFQTDLPHEIVFDLDEAKGAFGGEDYTLKRHYLYTCVTKHLLSKGVVRVHSSAVEYKGVAYAFGAPSGTGKSTHARLWNGYAGANYINDDQPFFAVENSVIVYPSPWAGKHNRYSEISAPLGGFVIIKQAKHNKIERLNKKQSILYLYKQVVQPTFDSEREKLLEFMEKVVDKVPFYLLECDKSKEAFKISFKALTGEDYED